PNVMLAAFWQRQRYPNKMVSGGPGGGLFQSLDGGKNWHRGITRLPKGNICRIRPAFWPSNPPPVGPTMEANKDENGTYVSDDAGATWRKANTLNPRPFYFSRPVIDPADANHFFLLAFTIHETKDGGKTFKAVGGELHPDHHAMWIDPADSDVM